MESQKYLVFTTKKLNRKNVFIIHNPNKGAAFVPGDLRDPSSNPTVTNNNFKIFFEKIEILKLFPSRFRMCFSAYYKKKHYEENRSHLAIHQVFCSILSGLDKFHSKCPITLKSAADASNSTSKHKLSRPY